MILFNADQNNLSRDVHSLQCVLTRGETTFSNEFSEEQVCNGLVLIIQVTCLSWLLLRGVWYHK